MAAPRHALQRKLLEGLRYLLRAHLLSQGVEGIPSNNTAVFDVLQEHGIAQPTPEGKAIWKATVVSPLAGATVSPSCGFHLRDLGAG